MHNNYDPQEGMSIISDIRDENKGQVNNLKEYSKDINPVLHPIDKIHYGRQLKKLGKIVKATDKFNYDAYNRKPNIIRDVRSAVLAHKIGRYQKKYGEDSLHPVIHRDNISLFSITEVNLLEVN
jgi:hypothetical protein